MEIIVSTKNGEINQMVRDKIQQKVKKLTRFFDRMTGIEVLVDLESNQDPKVEVKVSAEETNDFFAADRGNNVISALESVVRKLETQLRKHKEKITGHRGKTGIDNEGIEADLA